MKQIHRYGLSLILLLTLYGTAACGQSRQPALPSPSEAHPDTAAASDQVEPGSFPTEEAQPPAAAEDDEPAVASQSDEASPDLSTETTALIAFAGNLPDEEDDIYVMDTMGDNLVNLTNSPEDDSSPAWSPDGAQIVWKIESSDDVGDLYVMNADGSEKRQLTELATHLGSPAWSPDGTQIAFWIETDDQRDLYLINGDGGGLTPLTDDPANDVAPTWSPDGSQIAFTSDRAGNDDIFILDLASGSERQLTSGAMDERSAEWSPDGSQIAYFAELERNEEIFVTAVDGSSRTQLTDRPGDDFSPTWSPDSRHLLYLARLDETRELRLLDLTTNEQWWLPVPDGIEPGLADIQPGDVTQLTFGGEPIEPTEATAVEVVNADAVLAELTLTEATYITESFLGSQTEDSIYAGNCLARLLNNGQMVLYGNGRFELTLADTASVADCFTFEDGTTLTGTYEMDGGFFAVDYDFDEPLFVQNGDATIETVANGYVDEQLPSGAHRGGFGFEIRGSGDLGSGSLLYLVEGDLLADAAPDGESVPPIEIAYTVRDALANYDAPIFAPPPPNYTANAGRNDLSFGSASRVPAPEAVNLYKGYMSSLGWVVTQESTEADTTSIVFARNAEQAIIWVREGLTTIVWSSVSLSGEPWTAVPQMPLLEDAVLSGFRYGQNYELPVESNLDELVAYYQTTVNDELSAAGWTFDSSSGSETIKNISWTRPGGWTSASISEVSSQNRVGVNFSYAYTEPAVTGVDLTVTGTGAALAERIATQFEYSEMTIVVSEGDVETAVSALCNGTADVISTAAPLDDSAKQTCPGGQVVDFVIADMPLAVVINSENDWARNMTSAEAAAAFTTAQTWADVSPAWPDTPILRALPATGSPAYEALVATLFGGDATSLAEAANVFQFDTGFDVIWNGVGNGAGAIGFAPIDAVLENGDVATAVILDGNNPGDEGYLLTLPLVLSTLDTTMQTNLPLAAFLSTALNLSGDAAPQQVGYLPVDTATQQANEQTWLAVMGQ